MILQLTIHNLNICIQERDLLVADAGCKYDQIVEIDLSSLEPHINGPFTPDLATPLSQFAAAISKNGWPEELRAGLIGSCTNSSYEDMTHAASLAKRKHYAPFCLFVFF
jgi:aconitate hydratase